MTGFGVFAMTSTLGFLGALSFDPLGRAMVYAALEFLDVEFLDVEFLVSMSF
jgi:hypothetical protein